MKGSRFKCKLPVIFVRFQILLYFFDRSQNTNLNKFHKTHPVVEDLFHADTQTNDRQE
jgi:hypothetical protein